MPPDPQNHVGSVLDDARGGIRLDRLVGSGKFAWVFEAQRLHDDERVAVKLLYRDDAQATRRFLREVKVMRQLPPHPNCVGYHAHGETPEGRFWVAMEFVDGFNLQAVMAGRRRIPERAACALMSQLCDGFHAFHKLGLTHRDITPDNIMMTHRGRQVKLMDFGLMQDSQGLLELFEKHDILEGDDFADNLDAGLIAGTPEYMAPEQILDPRESDRSKQRTDTTADVFALGVIFYELLGGERLFPYEAGSGGKQGRDGLIHYLDYRLAWQTEDVECPSHVNAELWSILRKALMRDPNHRQTDATQLGEDIRIYLESGVGVMEDDMSATIAQDFDLTKLRVMANRGAKPGPGSGLVMTTGEFQSLRDAIAAAKESGDSEAMERVQGATTVEREVPASVRADLRRDMMRGGSPDAALQTRRPRPVVQAQPNPARSTLKRDLLIAVTLALVLGGAVIAVYLSQ